MMSLFCVLVRNLTHCIVPLMKLLSYLPPVFWMLAGIRRKKERETAAQLPSVITIQDGDRPVSIVSIAVG